MMETTGTAPLFLGPTYNPKRKGSDDDNVGAFDLGQGAYLILYTNG